MIAKSCRPLALLLVLLAGGCSDRPRALPLSYEAVYQNDKIGLRFLAPEGWTITMRTELPSGPLPKPIVLVGYVQSKGDKPAEFQLLAADLPEDKDLGVFLTEFRIGADKWVVHQTGQPVTVNGTAGTRYMMTRGTGKNEFRREATAFRRGGRVYFFIITFGVADPDRRDQARKSVESAVWSD
jgi:hypothetical protein